MVMVMVYLKPNVQVAELDIDGFLVGGNDVLATMGFGVG